MKSNHRISSWHEDNLIFPSNTGTPFSDSNVRKEFVKVLENANLPKIRFHDLRHTAASLMLNHNVPVLVVSKILGHSNPSVTLNIYAHSTVDMQSMAAGIMDKIVTPIPINLAQLHTTAHDAKN
ncbi:MAG: site-specific integrase [Anaerolineales bacterium]